MRNFFIFLIALIAVFPVIEAQNFGEYVDDLEQILGGSPVPHQEYLQLQSHIVAIRNMESNAICTGAIIAPHVVLTAAHCLEDGNFEIKKPKMEILIGSKVLGYETQRLPVVNSSVHPKYVRAYADMFDLALLNVKEAWPSYVQPAEIIGRDEFVKLKVDSKDFISLGLAGFGAMSTVSDNWSNQLRSVNKRVQISRVHENDIIVDQRDGFGTCVGDSGGPALVTIAGKRKIAAVVSTLLFPHTKDKEKCSYDSLLSIVYREMLNSKFEWVVTK